MGARLLKQWLVVTTAIINTAMFTTPSSKFIRTAYYLTDTVKFVIKYYSCINEYRHILSMIIMCYFILLTSESVTTSAVFCLAGVLIFISFSLFRNYSNYVRCNVCYHNHRFIITVICSTYNAYLEFIFLVG